MLWDSVAMGGNPTGLGRVVWLAAMAAFVARFPGLLWPLFARER